MSRSLLFAIMSGTLLGSAMLHIGTEMRLLSVVLCPLASLYAWMSACELLKK